MIYICNCESVAWISFWAKGRKRSFSFIGNDDIANHGHVLHFFCGTVLCGGWWHETELANPIVIRLCIDARIEDVAIGVCVGACMCADFGRYGKCVEFFVEE